MDKYLNEIKNAKSKDELRAITYKAIKDHNITPKQYDKMTALCVWKNLELQGALAILADCAKNLKLTKKETDKIKNY